MEPTAFSEEFLIVCDGLGMRETNDFIIDRRNFNNNLVMIVLKGELHVEQEGKHLILHSGEGVIMNLTVQHKYYTLPETGSKFVWMHFRGKPCETLMNKLYADEKLPFSFHDPNLWKKIYKCFQIITGERHEFTMSAMIYEIISEISEKAYSGNTNSDNFMENVNNYIEKNIFSDITLNDLAKNSHLSRFYFCRYFKNQTGISPMQYLTKKKIDAAKKILITGNDKIDVISNELGFTDRSHFSKSFKKYTGKSPAGYRKIYFD